VKGLILAVGAPNMKLCQHSLSMNPTNIAHPKDARKLDATSHFWLGTLQHDFGLQGAWDEQKSRQEKQNPTLSRSM